MRFDLLLAVFSSGLYAPLALMAGGFLLAVGGLAVLLWRRKKLAGPKPGHDEKAHDAIETVETPESEAFAAGPVETLAPAAPEGRRRRSLVGGAERESGTPAGAQADDGEAVRDIEGPDYDPPVEDTPQDVSNEAVDTSYAEPADHEAAFTQEALDDELSHDETEAASTGFEASEAYDAEPEPEWAGTELEEPSEAAVTVATAASVAEFEASSHERSDDEVEFADTPSETDVEPVALDTPMPAKVAIARSNPIVFRQFMPQSPKADGLSFFGGHPIGPADFQWPRAGSAQSGAPLQFVMQWDCSHLSQQDQTGLLPQDGVLYCFIDSDHGDDEGCLSSHTFVHHRGAVGSWSPIPVPEDAGPALGDASASLMSGCTPAIEDADTFVPQVLPRFPFAAIAMESPGADKDAEVSWSDDQAVAPLLEIQKSGVAVRQSANETVNANEEVGRPFPSFPHDFGAIRVIASRMIEALDNADSVLAEALYPELSTEELDAQFAGWREEAKEIYLLGTQRSLEQRLDQTIADDIWQWFEERRGILGPDISSVFEESVDLSLGFGSEALGTIPAKWIDKAMHSHALATECAVCAQSGKSHVLAHTPVRMFGPPSKMADAHSARAHEDILLLELPSDAGPQHKFQGRVLQYWISPDDLAAGNFDQVTLTIA